MEGTSEEQAINVQPKMAACSFRGVKAASGEFWVATTEGMQAVRSVRRTLVKEWWSTSSNEFVQRTRVAKTQKQMRTSRST